MVVDLQIIPERFLSVPVTGGRYKSCVRLDRWSEESHFLFPKNFTNPLILGDLIVLYVLYKLYNSQ